MGGGRRWGEERGTKITTNHLFENVTEGEKERRGEKREEPLEKKVHVFSQE